MEIAERSKMILLAADGATDKEISAELGVLRATVARWRGRYIEDGLSGIEQDGTRPGRKPQISERKVKAIVKMTTQQTPASATHCTLTRSVHLARASTGYLNYSAICLIFSIEKSSFN
ncbi:helix-turn-helix domain-containing protein [Undibacterium sp. Ji50W]|uniref:helix-turn-helix domain-containing protein n=1 Tax=Undibacterium sp. Ji50W TaxID=3413041 RepID=UPI003BF1694D